ncbi:MAG: Hpt domain-containing protein [Siculibacillus sp.]|nr:Hpt domain-containing protein [Siculibacillus sp.]
MNVIGFEQASAEEAAGRIGAMRREPAPIDLVHLARQTFGSSELEREVLRLFVLQGGDLVRRIAATGDAVERAEIAHRLKGSARAIGAMRVGRLAEALETATAGEVAGLLEEIGRAVAEVEHFVAGLLAPAA